MFVFVPSSVTTVPLRHRRNGLPVHGDGDRQLGARGGGHLGIRAASHDGPSRASCGDCTGMLLPVRVARLLPPSQLCHRT